MVEETPRSGCLWPMWPHAARPSHEYCGHRRAIGSSYCEEHRALSIRGSDDEPERPFVPNKIAA